MKNISFFCLTLNPENEQLIKNLSYIPVGLGKKIFQSTVYQTKMEKISQIKIHFMENTLFITGFGKIIYKR